MRLVILIMAAVVALAAGCVRQPTETTYSARSRAAGTYWEDVSGTGLADGTHNVFVNVKRISRPDFRIVQDGGSGTISFQVYASWDPDAATYDDIGLDFYGSATFTGVTTKLLDDGAKLRTATSVKIVFTVAGASSDASYTIEHALELAKD